MKSPGFTRTFTMLYAQTTLFHVPMALLHAQLTLLHVLITLLLVSNTSPSSDRCDISDRHRLVRYSPDNARRR